MDKQGSEGNGMDNFKALVDLGQGLVEAVRPAGQPDVGAADDEVAILFETPEAARLIYDLLTGVGTGIKILEPGEVVLRDIPEWQQASLNFAVHVRYLKPEVIAAVLDAIGEHVEEAAWNAAADSLREDMAALVEFNPYHTADDGTFASKGQLKRAKKGSWSDGRRKNKVSGKGKGKALKLVATSHPCGRDARDAGSNKRCWDGQKINWTGHAVARVIKRAKQLGKVEGALTADDRVILERAVRAWAARAALVGEARGDKKKDKELTAVYEKWFEGIPVNIMDLGKARREIEALLAKGADLDKEMPGIVKKYRAEDVEGDAPVLDEKTREQMDAEREVRAMVAEAKFPSAGKGMEWGEYEQVTPENLAGYVERLKRDEGMFVIATYTRETWFDAKAWAKWEAVGKPMIRVAKDGKGLYSLEGKKYVYSPSTSPTVKWVPKQKVQEEGTAPRSVRALLNELSEGAEQEWVVRVNSRRVQWGEASYNRFFGKENIADGINYAFVKAASAEEAVRKFCEGEKPNTGLNEFYFEAEPKKPKMKAPAPFRWKGGKPLTTEEIADDLAARIEGMDEAALDAFANEIDEALTSVQRQAKKDYKRQDWGKTQEKAGNVLKSMEYVHKYSTKKLLALAKVSPGPTPAGRAMRQAVMQVLKARIAKGKSGKMKLRKR